MASKDNEDGHPHRQIIHNFVPLDLCKELEYIHKSNCTVGYRPFVFSTTLSHLIATNSPHLLMPFITLRDKLKDKVEQVFDCQYELFIEFTGLISWNKGASIGWHSDDNRPYLQQRHFTAVCYLNSYGEDFCGGVFHFQNGEPNNYIPVAGDLVLYSADSRNIHCVDEVTAGERITLTLWFSRNSSFDEDTKLLSLLAQKNLDNGPGSCIPLPAPSNMYWFSLDQDPDDQRGYDICFARLFSLGYDISSTQEQGFISEKPLLDTSDVFTKPLQLAKEDMLYSRKFANLLHALQVVQFYLWKQPLLQELKVGMDDDAHDTNDVVSLTVEQKEAILELRSVLLSMMHVDKAVFCYSSTGKNREHHFDWACFSAAIKSWEEYTLELRKQLLMHLPFWKDYLSLFSVSSSLIEK